MCRAKQHRETERKKPLAFTLHAPRTHTPSGDSRKAPTFTNNRPWMSLQYSSPVLQRHGVSRLHCSPPPRSRSSLAAQYPPEHTHQSCRQAPTTLPRTPKLSRPVLCTHAHKNVRVSTHTPISTLHMQVYVWFYIVSF